MWACFKECVSEAFPTIGTYTVLAIVAGLIAVFAGLTVGTGGAAPGFFAVAFAAVETAVGTYAAVGAASGLTAILSGLTACIIKCLFG